VWGEGKIKCSVCKDIFKEEDMIMIDMISTITHSKCVHSHNPIPLRYLGPFNYFKNSCPHINI